MTLAPTFADAVRGRSPEVVEYGDLFVFDHLPTHLARVSAIFHDAAVALLAEVGDGPQLVHALEQLVRSKDSAVRQAVRDQRDAERFADAHPDVVERMATVTPATAPEASWPWPGDEEDGVAAAEEADPDATR